MSDSTWLCLDRDYDLAASEGTRVQLVQVHAGSQDFSLVRNSGRRGRCFRAYMAPRQVCFKTFF